MSHTVHINNYVMHLVRHQLAASTADNKTLTLIFSPYDNDFMYRVEKIDMHGSYTGGFATLDEAIQQYNSL
jgi:hypothetical protein